MAEAKAIEAVLGKFCDCINAKDATTLSGLFTEDAEFVNIFGMRMRGRVNIESGHRAVFEKALSGNKLGLLSVETKVPAPNVAICHAAWKRDRLPDAPEAALPAGTGILTVVMIDQGGQWRMAAVTNVQDAAPGKK
jgi:uncharacterized protein (TIGR02246 family)